MKWFIREVNDFREAINKRVDDLLDKWAAGQLQDAERLQKLEGEIKAMKARMGKKEQ